MMQADDVLAILARLAAAEVAVWLDGGWGVDALLRHATRPHDDLDLVVRLDQVERIAWALAPLGFRLSCDERPIRCVLSDPADRRIDCHTVRFDAVGNGLQRLPGGCDFTYPAAGFTGQGMIGGRSVPCLTPEVQLLCHTGYPLDDTDRHDMQLLHEKFGPLLPAKPGV